MDSKMLSLISTFAGVNAATQ